MSEKIKSFLIYGGLTKEHYMKAKPYIAETNKKIMKHMSLYLGIVFCLVYIISFSGNEMLQLFRGTTLGAAVIFLVLYFDNTVKRSNYVMVSVDIKVYFFIIVLLSVVMFIDVVCVYGDKTVMLFVIIFMVSILFCIPPIAMIAIITGVNTVYIVLMNEIQSGNVFRANIHNAVFFALMSIFVCFLQTKRYADSGYTEAINYDLKYKDYLTGLNNRNKYEEDLKKNTDSRTDVIVAYFEVDDDLRKLNWESDENIVDSFIKSLANCISNSFGKFGTCYRTNGAQFVAIMAADLTNISDLCKEFEKSIEEWNRNNNTRMSVSYGIAEHKASAGSFEITMQKAYKRLEKMKREHCEKM